MGSCASAQRNSQTDMKLGLSFGSKTDKLVIPRSPIKDKPGNGNFRIDDIALKSQWSPSRSTKSFKDYGSKEEAFFDSKPWLESDTEEDFCSVNGDFTPSGGNTPVHQSYSFGTPNVKNTIPVSVPEPSPTAKKKNLLELFRESLRDDQDDDENKLGTLNMANGEKQVKQTIHDVLPKSAQSTPYISGTNSMCDSERSMNGDHVSIRGKTVKSVPCCLPSLASCRSFSERRRKMNPAIAANGKPRHLLQS